MSEFRLSSQIKVVNPVSNIDKDYGVYVNVAAAEAAIPVALRMPGKTVGVLVAGVVVEYWWADGVNLTPKGAAVDLSSKADLVGGRVPASQLPSYVDDVIEANDYTTFPVIGEAGKIYVARDTGIIYRWASTDYIEISNTDMYQSTELTTVTAFGIPAGSYLEGLPVREILRLMLTPFLTPTVEILSVVGYAAIQEVGTVIPDTLTYNLGIANAQNLAVFTYDDGINPYTLPVTNPLTIPRGAGPIYMDEPLVYPVYLTALDIKGGQVDSFYSFTAAYRQFYGNATAAPTNSAQVRALANSNFANVNNFVTDVVTGTRYSIAIPNTKTLQSVITANNENITSGFIVQNFIVDDAAGTGVNYKVYTFTSVLPLLQTLTVTLI